MMDLRKMVTDKQIYPKQVTPTRAHQPPEITNLMAHQPPTRAHQPPEITNLMAHQPPTRAHQPTQITNIMAHQPLLQIPNPLAHQLSTHMKIIQGDQQNRK